MRRSSSTEIDDNGSGNAVPVLHSIRDRFPFKRNSSHFRLRAKDSLDHATPRSRSHQSRINRKGLLWWLPARGQTFFYFVVVFAVFAFVSGSMLLQSSISLMSSPGSERGRWLMERIKFGSSLKFFPGRISRRLVEGVGLDEVRKKDRVGVRAPRLALILGSMESNPQSLMLITVMKNIQKLGYVLEIFAVESGNEHSMWKQIGGQPSILSPEHYGHVDWSIYDGIIADSLEAEGAIASLMQEPFCSVPLIWIVREDTLANRLPMYEQRGWKHLISHWKSSFRRANIVVFPDFSLPMLYSILDNGNFYVIPGSPADVYAAENYKNVHSKSQLREKNGFNEDDILVIVVGSLFFPNELSWDYAVAMHSIGPLLTKYARQEVGGSFKFVFLCCNSTDGSHGALQEIASRLGLPDASITHYGLNGDVNNVLMMADIVLYGSSQEIQSFPPLLIRAMSFGIPIMVPDLPALRNYIVDGVHGVIFPKHNPDALLDSFSRMISDGKLSRFSQAIASSGKLLAKNILASECVTSYARLLENVLNFPSDVKLPGSVSQLQLGAWEWNLFREEAVQTIGKKVDTEERIAATSKSSVIFALEAQITNFVNLTNSSETENGTLEQDIPTPHDWDILEEIENAEEYETVEMEEFQERMERDLGAWDEIYRNARKSEKLKFEANERDEGELERTGQPVSIYEIYNGAGAWPFMHHGSLYRGLSLSTRALRLKSDDVNAVGRLPLLNDSYYPDTLCEIGGMFAIANKIDNIHKRPWIGFQSWRASGRKVSLFPKAENVLEDTIRDNTKGDVIYFWAHLQVNRGILGGSNAPTFWSVCDILNGGLCRTAFENTFREMFGLSSNMEALPPMPDDGGRWSALHSWVMPTPSFLEFIMFSRMFTHYLDAVNRNQSQPYGCLVASSELEKKHCYCRILEILVNVWAYHSGRRMVYIDPHSGFLEEQHPVEQRREFMWAKYFNSTLLKSMDEDLAEAADDEGGSNQMGLWPLTGEVHWQGIYEREREERYRVKMDKKRTTKVKLMERMKFGYKQKSLAG
ncbi:uncharacterized protein LOC111459418 isoform X1 [Cucurbita moschata]|uniref:Uncharacterized protein LOC111459418 isoform X1 n=2 Tax=Cucurbita TaxID=3660 RepID=A0A6J1H431_CUCMO